jgi:hypothetical protein
MFSAPNEKLPGEIIRWTLKTTENAKKISGSEATPIARYSNFSRSRIAISLACFSGASCSPRRWLRRRITGSISRPTEKYSKIAWVGEAKKITVAQNAPICHIWNPAPNTKFDIASAITSISIAIGPWNNVTRRNASSGRLSAWTIPSPRISRSGSLKSSSRSSALVIGRN